LAGFGRIDTQVIILIFLKNLNILFYFLNFLNKFIFQFNLINFYIKFLSRQQQNDAVLHLLFRKIDTSAFWPDLAGLALK